MAGPTELEATSSRPERAPGRSTSAAPTGAVVGPGATVRPRPVTPRGLLALQRSAGNAAATRLMGAPATGAAQSAAEPATADLAEAGGAPLASVTNRVAEAGVPDPPAVPQVQRQQPVVQRQTIADEPLIKAMALVNKTSVAKVKLPVKAPPGLKVFGPLEVKKVELELDLAGELSSPNVSASTGPKMQGGKANTSQTETNASDGKQSDAQAAVYALELSDKFKGSDFEKLFGWKVGVEHGRYEPTNALTPAKRDFKGKLGVNVGADGWELAVEFTPLAYDSSKKGADAWKVTTFTTKISKELSTSTLSFPYHDKTINAKLKGKVTISLEIGPDYAATAQILGRFFPKEKAVDFIVAASPQIAKEEVETFSEKLATEMIDARLQGLKTADPAVADLIRREARKALLEDMAAREVKAKLAEESSIFIRREMMEKAAQESSIMAISASGDVIVRQTVKKFLEGAGQAALLRQAMRASIEQAVKSFSLKSAAQKVAQSLIPGPADFVLIGVQILYNSVDVALKDTEMKTIGLQALAMRDNYVSGYVDGLKGSGHGTGGAADSGANLPGAAMTLGLSEGDQQFEQAMGLAQLGDSGATPAELRPAVAQQMAEMPVNREQIVAKAAPKLKQLIMDGLERKYSGGALRFLFGEDFKGSKDEENFSRVIDSFLNTKAGNVTTANLANGVKVELVMLDSTSDRAQVFRTADGRFSGVTIQGDTQTHSGWITAEGQPLEEVYADQNAAGGDVKAADEARIAKHRTALAAGRLEISGKFNGLDFKVNSATLRSVPDDLEFAEFRRSPEFQAMTPFSAGLVVRFDGETKWDADLYNTVYEGKRKKLSRDVVVWFSLTTAGAGPLNVPLITHDPFHPELTGAEYQADLTAALTRTMSRRFAAMNVE